ncbi:MAG: transglycosylase domain-containing protein [Pseudorhodobacter sp.]|nr:transglycosylase domain-containing protein [Rhizobacter sp.]
MIGVNPQSTTFQRSEITRLATEEQRVLWAQEWVDYTQISDHLKRAVIASEDAGFVDHSGVEWDAIEKAWDRNQRSETQAVKSQQQSARKPSAGAKPGAEPKLVGGSTITQQLAKNLFLGSERNLPRKLQELVITLMLEKVLSKQRILEIYLNNVEWGEGVFGAEAAAGYYFRTRAALLSPAQAARLAVMLPAPKRFEKRPGSSYVIVRSGIVQARMSAVELP